MQNPYKEIVPYRFLAERSIPHLPVSLTESVGVFNPVREVFTRGIFWTSLPESAKKFVKKYISAVENENWAAIGFMSFAERNFLKWYVGQWVEAQWYKPEGWEKKIDENNIADFCDWLKQFHIKPF